MLLTVIMLINSIAFTQTSSNDSTKCFTYEQVRKITKAIKHGQLCDSISQDQALQIFHFKSILRTQDERYSLVSNKLTETDKELNKTGLKLKISKNISKYGIPSALLGGFFIGYMLK